eukprot:CAMPEP_0178407450 /NCGR_PEP_ID=MMETSP0689_2-20121128/19436_1 /TAXON_ID=160604 /ORGANISM="Amphidinium massartii, Strain CS-259" /LENGTH=526 /DNA_ID=CAMNT_0020028527 /DNA_START=378 /DNA_END=1958 /DNA_ORIENTATION=+
MPPVSDAGVQSLRPVLTMRFFQWNFSMPLLHILIGCYVFGRPFSEVWPAIFVTDTYIVLSWEALILPYGLLRGVLVALSFVGYIGQACDMWMWAVETRQSAMPVRNLRIALLIAHICFYGIYGVVYLLAVGDLISSWSEYICYFVLDMTVKGMTATVVSMIHKADMYYNGMSMAAKAMEANNLLSSLLRASCDAVLLCEITRSGGCELSQDEETDELASLEHKLGYRLLGVDVEEIIDTAHSRAQFRAYVQNVWHQAHTMARKGTEAQSQSHKASHLAPLAQIIHSRLKVLERRGTNSSKLLPRGIAVTIMISVPVQRSVGLTGCEKVNALLGLKIIDDFGTSSHPTVSQSMLVREDSDEEVPSPYVPLGLSVAKDSGTLKVRSLARELGTSLLETLQMKHLAWTPLALADHFRLAVRSSMQHIVVAFCCLLRMESGSGVEAAVEALYTGLCETLSTAQPPCIDGDPVARTAANLMEVLKQSLRQQSSQQQQQQQARPFGAYPGLPAKSMARKRVFSSGISWKKDT